MPWFNTLTGKFLTVRVYRTVIHGRRWNRLANTGLFIRTFIVVVVSSILLKHWSRALQALGRNIAVPGRTFICISVRAVSAMMIVWLLRFSGRLIVDDLDIGFKGKRCCLNIVGRCFPEASTLKQSWSAFRMLSGFYYVDHAGKRSGSAYRANTRTQRVRNHQDEDDGTREMRVMSVDHDVVKALGWKSLKAVSSRMSAMPTKCSPFIVNEAAENF